MNSLEFIKQHVTELPARCTKVRLDRDGEICFRGCELSHDFYPDDFAPDYYDGKKWTREEFEACGVAEPVVDWNKAPSWANSYGTTPSCKHPLWYNHEQYMYIYAKGKTSDVFDFSTSLTLTVEDVTHIESRPIPSVESATGIDATVEERGNRYGAFKDGADIMQELKSVMRSTPNWSQLTPSQREALEMIQHKVGRILNGDPNYTDSWHDIKGYAHLIEEELNGNVK